MLVLISDLHFVDGTAGAHNIKPKAFDYFFQDLHGIIDDQNNAIKQVTMVFLGDIFDLLRTCNWFDSPKDERPWGTITAQQPNPLEVHAETILDSITANDDNKISLQAIRDNLTAIKQKCPNSEALYFPGNHDRLVNQFPSLRTKVCASLGLSHNPNLPFDHFAPFGDYGVFARHGHEFDFYNYEGGPTFTQADYLQVPLGDPITTELVSRLPYEIKKLLAATSLPPAEQAAIVRNFQQIDNVRPFGAVIEWLLYQVQDQPPWLKDLIDEAVDTCIREFNQLPFVQDWFSRHDKWYDPFDKADQIQIALYILEKFKVFSLEKLFSLATKAKGLQFDDGLLEAAPQESALLSPGISYVVYGHTHEPLVVPLRVRQSEEQIYLNTGTWRGRYNKATRDNSFIGWKNMTYVIFYRDEERPGREADFETWTGTLKTG